MRVLLRFILPVGIALVFGFFFIDWLRDKEPVSEIIAGNYLPKPCEYMQTPDALLHHLQNEHNLLLMGSSELSSHSNYVPHKWLSGASGLRALSLGSAGHQSMSILAQMVALGDFIKGAKIGIIVSPGWFEDRFSAGTSLKVFLDQNPLWFTSSLLSSPDNHYRSSVLSYMGKNSGFLSGADPAWKLAYYKSSGEVASLLSYPLISANSIWLAYLHQNYLPQNYLPTSLLVQSLPDFDSLETAALIDFKSRSAGNNLAISDKYFQTWLQSDATRRGRIRAIDTNANTELQHALLLIDYMAQSGADVCWIIQPLNPYYYPELQSLTPTMGILKRHIETYNMPLLDLFEPDTAYYVRGMLDDVMHMGDFGWLKVNQFLINTYYD